jgi:peptidoglycan/LPS O-acetylase OafA/YrhL
MQKQINIVVALRGIAALAVALFHIVCSPIGFVTDAFTRHVFIHGAYGVQLFFVISGLVIPLSMIKGEYSIRKFGKFMLKRTIRIEPTYIVTILLCCALIILRRLILGEAGNPLPSLNEMVANVTYVVPFTQFDWINPVFWTLGVELQYYLFIALIWPAFNIFKSNWMLLLLPALSWLLPAFFGTSFFFHHFGFFAVGCILALFIAGRIPFVWMLSTEIFVHASIFVAYDKWSFLLISALTAISILLIPQRSGGKILNFIGRQSYSLYLIHGLVGATFVNLSMRYFDVESIFAKSFIVLLAVVLSLMAGQLIYLIIEKPSMRISKKISLKD